MDVGELLCYNKWAFEFIKENINKLDNGCWRTFML